MRSFALSGTGIGLLRRRRATTLCGVLALSSVCLPLKMGSHAVPHHHHRETLENAATSLKGYGTLNFPFSVTDPGFRHLISPLVLCFAFASCSP